MRTIIRPLVPRMEYGLRLYFKRIPYSFFSVVFCTFFFMTHSGSAQGVSCYSQLNISILNGRPAKLSISMLTPRTDLTNLVAEAPDRDELIFGCSDIASEVMVTLRDTVSNEICMITVTIEDKSEISINCSEIDPVSVSLGSGNETLVNLDTLFPMITDNPCDNNYILGRKLSTICAPEDLFFLPFMNFCFDELSDLVDIEVKVVRPDGIQSNSCFLSIDVTENVPPVITPVDDAIIQIMDNDERTVTLDTSDIIESLIDNSSCISSLVMTGSGLGPITGSGLPFFTNGTFMTFTCADTGMYDVQIIATDCDNNMDTIVTKLTVDPEENCAPDNTMSISGQIIANDELPLPNVNLKYIGEQTFVEQSDENGSFLFEYSEGEIDHMLIEHHDEYLRGLSVIDVKLIQERILNRITFSDWQEAAADMDQSGYISALDLVEIRRLLLGISEIDASNGAPWIFALSKKPGFYSNRLELEMPVIEELTQLDIFAAKMGDVNGDAMSKEKSDYSVGVEYVVERLDLNHSNIVFDLSQLSESTALQLNLAVDDGIIEEVTVPEGFYFHSTDHSVAILWYDLKKLPKLEPIAINVNHSTENAPTIRFSEELASMMYNEKGEEISIDFQEMPTKRQNLVNETFSIFPNPVVSKSYISYSGDEISSNVQFTISTITGQKIFNEQFEDRPIDQIFPYLLPQISESGLYFVSIRFQDQLITKKIFIN